VRLDVALGPGVLVVAPGAADLVTLEHEESAFAAREQLDRHAEPAETGADDEDLEGLGVRRRRRVGNTGGGHVGPTLRNFAAARNTAVRTSGRPVSLRPPASHTTVRAVPHAAVQRTR
jgi:hypothetical protein